MSTNHKKKSVQQQNRKHQDRMAHRKKQIQSGKSEDFFRHMHPKKEQTPELKAEIAERLAKGI